MRIVELTALSDVQVLDILVLMRELDPEIAVTSEMLRRAVEAAETHFFAALEDDGHVMGCASFCVFASPTGRKASVEDVVVSSSCRGRRIGRQLVEAILDFARRELAPVEIHLTSRPHRVAANELYRSLGFQQKETNVYRLCISG
ncbi:MAG: GNAT family N-acetyltransferase [Bacteroidales bacterium]|nr:GNAT family N-acetyltransferase [Bacteroidales bacterium]